MFHPMGKQKYFMSSYLVLKTGVHHPDHESLPLDLWLACPFGKRAFRFNHFFIHSLDALDQLGFNLIQFA
jgi:hypothetical protein